MFRIKPLSGAAFLLGATSLTPETYAILGTVLCSAFGGVWYLSSQISGVELRWTQALSATNERLKAVETRLDGIEHPYRARPNGVHP